MNRFFNLYFNPTGRLNRGGWWAHSVFLLWIGAFCLFFVTALIGRTIAGYLYDAGSVGYSDRDAIMGIGILVSYLWFIIAGWCYFALSAKRFHDQDRSASYFLLVLIPFVGALVTLVMLGFVAGTEGENRYGADTVDRLVRMDGDPR